MLAEAVASVGQVVFGRCIIIVAILSYAFELRHAVFKFGNSRLLVEVLILNKCILVLALVFIVFIFIEILVRD